MPVQDFGNAFSTFIAQNYGAKEKKEYKRTQRSCSYLFNILYNYFYSSLYICETLMIYLYRCKWNKYHLRRCTLLKNRRCILYRYRLFILVIWFISCLRKTRYECCSYSLLTWHKSRFSLYLIFYTSTWSNRYMVVSSIGWALADIVGLVYYKRINTIY